MDKSVEMYREFTHGIDLAVIGDHNALQNVVVNLCLNAQDAMPDGGSLRITSTSRYVSPAECAALPFEIEPGEHVELRFIDTGTGMQAEVIERAFEPFFTTKPAGKGTGLGLAASYGTIAGHRGAITVTSEVEVVLPSPFCSRSLASLRT